MKPSYIFLTGLAATATGVIYAAFGDITPAQSVFHLVPPPLGSDGTCTGFPSGFLNWNWKPCCVGHDAGASDGWLLDCLLKVVPPAAAPLAASGVTLMVLFRPIYNLGQKWKFWK